MREKLEKILEGMEPIEYGFKDEKGNNIIITDPEKWDNEFDKFYFLQTPEELQKSKCGVCWDQVELERKLLEENKIPSKTYFIYIFDDDMLPSHTFLTIEEEGRFYWMEHAWGVYKGVHEYKSEKELLEAVKKIFIKEHSEVSKGSPLYIYEYKKPQAKITCDEFYKYIETQNCVLKTKVE